MPKPRLSYDIKPVSPDDIHHLLDQYHPYKGGRSGRVGTYCWGVVERGDIVAAYLWTPPPYGAAKSVCPTAPWSVLALSRMVATPRDSRRLNHVSKPLKRQMKSMIDRSRWPCLVTWHDEGSGHTGHVYKCSGWNATSRRKSKVYLDDSGARVSRYSSGQFVDRGNRVGDTWLQRWEHHICPPGSDVSLWMASQGWHREAIPGKTWASGKQAHRIVNSGGVK